MRRPAAADSVAASAYPLVFLQRAQVGRVRLSREQAGPQGPANLADIKIAARIGGEPMRPDERSRRRAGMRVTDTRQQLALVIDDADAWAEIRAVAVDCH